MARLLITFGSEIRDERRRRRLTLRDLARMSGLSAATVHSIEIGDAGSLDAYVRLASALSRTLEIDLIDPRRRTSVRANLAGDAVHSAMGEFEARHLRQLGRSVGIDEPYQHFQFAGRADVISWDLEARDLLHIENRTRFPDFQEMAGAYNAKRAYLPPALADRLGLRGWRSVTHAMAVLWSAETTHVLRLRKASFTSLCPDDTSAFTAWWRGEPVPPGITSTLVLVDPIAASKQRAFVGLADAATVRPRYRGYAFVATALSRAADNTK